MRHETQKVRQNLENVCDSFECILEVEFNLYILSQNANHIYIPYKYIIYIYIYIYIYYR